MVVVEVFVVVVDADDDADVVVGGGAVRRVDRRRDKGLGTYPGFLLLLDEGAGGDGQGGGGICYFGEHAGREGGGEVRPPGCGEPEEECG